MGCGFNSSQTKPRKAEEVKEEVLSQPNGEAPAKWTARGRGQLENEPGKTPDSPTLVEKGVETKAVVVPEPAAVVPEPEAKEEPRASSLKMGPQQKLCRARARRRLKRSAKPEPYLGNASCGEPAEAT